MTNMLYVSDAGTAFTPAPADTPAMTTVNRILVLTPDELYYAGGGSGTGPLLIRAKR